jgi:dienelactone hydrolase
MIVERTHYFARNGRSDEVLKVRREASRVRLSLGLPVGTITCAHGGDGPDVAWQCAFPDEEAHRADLAARDASPDFAAVRERMGALLDRFERLIERCDDTAAVEGGLVETDIAGCAIVPQEHAFASQGRTLKGYLYLPPGPGPFPCMITNHGSQIEKGSEDVCRPGTAALLMSWGVASFLPHRHGYGNSPGPGWLDDVTAEFGTSAYDAQLGPRLDRESDDVLAAFDHLSGLPTISSDHIGVMGSSFGGTNTLLAAAKTDRFRCAVEFAGAAINWEHAPGLRTLMLEAAARVACPIYFIQAATDYSTRPTVELAAAARAAGVTVEEKIFPPWGLTRDEGHLFERHGPHVWGPDVRRFLARWL